MACVDSGASSALAGPVIVNQGMSSADTFALRDRLAREHEWQEWLRFQQAIKWLEVLPVNCDLVGGAGGSTAGDDYYRPYRQNGRDIYIQGIHRVLGQGQIKSAIRRLLREVAYLAA